MEICWVASGRQRNSICFSRRSRSFNLFKRSLPFRRYRHLFIEFVSGPVSIGEDIQIIPDEKEFEGKILKIFSPTDCIKDRLCSYIHFKARECLDQALLVAKNQRFDLRQIKEWCFREGELGRSAFEEFQALL